MMQPDDFEVELEAALDEYRFDDVGPLIDQLDPTAFDERQVKRALSHLRRKRLFAQLERAASLFDLVGHRGPVVKRQWAQALLDQNRVGQAVAALQTLSQSVADDPVEGPEVRGLLGRAYKQLYLNHGDKQHLVQAIEAYGLGFHARQGDYRWQGINLAALLARARRDGIAPGVGDDASEVACVILDEIRDADGLRVWDYGTAMEASVALGDEQGALKWAKKYARHPEADAFELASSTRQLKELWQLEGTELGQKLLPVLEYELLRREGAALELTAARVTDTRGFEAVYGPDGYVFVEWMDTMYARSRSVARVFDTAEGKRVGTGFLMKGSDLCGQWGEAPVFVTNSHVLSPNRADEAPLGPEEGSAEFTRLPGRPKAELGEILFSSPRVDLDVTVTRIQPPDEAEWLKPSWYPPVVAGEDEAQQRIYVMGHPKGAELAVSLYDNSLVGYEDPYVHYRSPTEGGSSGSPVFTRKWKVFALHHRTRQDRQINEGVLFGPIKKATGGA